MLSTARGPTSDGAKRMRMMRKPPFADQVAPDAAVNDLPHVLHAEVSLTPGLVTRSLCAVTLWSVPLEASLSGVPQGRASAGGCQVAIEQLALRRAVLGRVCSQFAPKIGHWMRNGPALCRAGPLTCRFNSGERCSRLRLHASGSNGRSAARRRVG